MNRRLHPHAEGLTVVAKAFLDLRRERQQTFPPELFGGELAWDILLILFVADANGDKSTGYSAVREAGGSNRVGRRWIEHLTAAQMVVGDGEGDLNDTLTLSAQGLDAMENWLAAARHTFAS